MTPATARKIVVAAAVVGTAAIVYQGGSSNFETSYRRVWGLLLLTVGGSILADFAPMVVGPYMALVLLWFLLNNKTALSGILKSASSATTTTTP